MSQDNVNILRDGYDAFARRDLGAVLGALAEDVDWHVPDSVPFGGDYRGHDGVTEFFGRLLEHWRELSVQPEEFIDGGDTIVVRVGVTGTGSAGSITTESVHLWRMRAGRATSFTEYTDTALALQAIGHGTVATAG